VSLLERRQPLAASGYAGARTAGLRSVHPLLGGWLRAARTPGRFANGLTASSSALAALAGGLRVVATDAADEDSVLADLVAEARRLPTPRSGAAGRCQQETAATTLIACGGVPEWRDFLPFRTFFAEELQNGYALMDEFSLKVVAFHPEFVHLSLRIQRGDTVAVAGPDGITIVCEVSDAAAGGDEQGEEQVAVLLPRGGLLGGTAEEEWLVSRTAILRVVQRHGGAPPDEADLWCRSSGQGELSDFCMRAPRPVLHLLRLADLDRAAGSGVAKFNGSTSEATMQRNRRMVREFGERHLRELLQRCG